MRRKPECPPKPPDLADRVKQMMSGTDEPPPLPLTEPPPLDPVADQAGPSQSSLSDTPSLSDVPSLSDAPQLKGKKINGDLEGLDIPFIDETDNADIEHSERCPGK